MSPHCSLVTGVAGFIGSHVAERLLDADIEVRGLDSLTPYYEPAYKEANLETVRGRSGFQFHKVDLSREPLEEYLEGVDVVFHLAAQPGVRSSWESGFRSSVTHNVIATQRLLEASRRCQLRRFVYASSSSVYGNAYRAPMHEELRLHPQSPYGVTKLSGEQLCGVYAYNWGLPTVALRYFTVYGPRQRPDMAIHRLFQAALCGGSFDLYGDGAQRRDFTYVADVVEATLRAAEARLSPGTVINVAGGSVVSINQVMSAVEKTTGRKLYVRRRAQQPGDVQVTQADLERAYGLLRWCPSVDLHEGLALQSEWHRTFFRSD